MKQHNWEHKPEFDFDFDDNGIRYNSSYCEYDILKNVDIKHSYAFVCSVCKIRMHTINGKAPVPISPSDDRIFWDCDLFIVSGVHDI